VSLADLLWLPPLLLAVACVVGGTGRDRGEVAPHVRRAFWALLVGVVAVGAVVRTLVLLFA